MTHLIAVGGSKLVADLGSGQGGSGRLPLRTCSSNRTGEIPPSGMIVERGGNVIRLLDGTLTARLLATRHSWWLVAPRLRDGVLLFAGARAQHMPEGHRVTWAEFVEALRRLRVARAYKRFARAIRKSPKMTAQEQRRRLKQRWKGGPGSPRRCWSGSHSRATSWTRWLPASRCSPTCRRWPRRHRRLCLKT